MHTLEGDTTLCEHDKQSQELFHREAQASELQDDKRILGGLSRYLCNFFYTELVASFREW